MILKLSRWKAYKRLLRLYMRKLWNRPPEELLIYGFLVIMLIGAFLLRLPIAVTDGEPLSFIDAVFMAVTSTCVTGLTVVDVATKMSGFGQAVMLVLIQIGGLGFMTMSILVLLFMGKKVGLKNRILIKDSFNYVSLSGVIDLLKRVVILTFTIEAIGAVALWVSALRYLDWLDALWFGVFYSVSSFCNAGIDALGIFSQFEMDVPINIIVDALIILGGLGFAVIGEMLRYRKTKKISLNSRLVLVMTGILLAFGTVMFMLFEWDNPSTIGMLSWPEKFLISFMHSVSARTAGYSTLSLECCSGVTLFLMTCLMFIGASPGSTGGGIKTTTFGVLLLSARAVLKGEEDINWQNKQISWDTSRKSFVILLLALVLIVTATLIICYLEKSHGFLFVHVLFEVASAAGTVGLSVGITPLLGDFAKVMIIILMFIGRVGSFTIGMALAANRHSARFHYAEEKISVG